MLHLFKVSNKDNRTKPLTSLGDTFIVNFEQAWMIAPVRSSQLQLPYRIYKNVDFNQGWHQNLAPPLMFSKDFFKKFQKSFYHNLVLTGKKLPLLKVLFVNTEEILRNFSGSFFCFWS